MVLHSFLQVSFPGLPPLESPEKQQVEHAASNASASSTGSGAAMALPLRPALSRGIAAQRTEAVAAETARENDGGVAASAAATNVAGRVRRIEATGLTDAPVAVAAGAGRPRCTKAAAPAEAPAAAAPATAAAAPAAQRRERDIYSTASTSVAAGGSLASMFSRKASSFSGETRALAGGGRSSRPARAGDSTSPGGSASFSGCGSGGSSRPERSVGGGVRTDSYESSGGGSVAPQSGSGSAGGRFRIGGFGRAAGAGADPTLTRGQPTTPRGDGAIPEEEQEDIKSPRRSVAAGLKAARRRWPGFGGGGKASKGDASMPPSPR